MRLNILLIPVVAAGLCGCSDVSSFDEALLQAATTPPARVAATAPDAGFCRNVARQQAEGFDGVTLQHNYTADFRQCMVVFAGASPDMRVAELGPSY